MISTLSPDFTLTPLKRAKKEFYSNITKGNTPQVSIITPFFNTGNIFWETYESVCLQSFQNFEWIIVDDCSSDQESIAILEEVQRIDSRVRVIKNKENRGIAFTRNVGVRNAKCDFLFLIDSDDLFEPTYLEKSLLFLLLNEEYSFVASFLVAYESQEYLWSKGFTEGEKYLHENFGTSNFFARRSIFEKVEYDESIDPKVGGEDWDFWLKCAENGFWGYCIPEFLQWYRIKKKRVWGMLDKENHAKMTKALKKKYAHLENNFPNPKFSRYFLWEEEYNLKVSSALKAVDLGREEVTGKNVLFVLPWMVYGGADKFNLDLVQYLTEKGWKITIATTVKSDNSWLPEFEKFTPDIFMLGNICEESFYGEAISYLVKSRNINLLFTSNSESGYILLPYLKNRFPDLPVIDYLHSVPLDWRNGGYPRLSAALSASIDKHVVSSNQLNGWMVQNGVPATKLETCYINVDITRLSPDATLRASLRKKIKVDDTTCVIIFVARLSKEKQPAVLLQTAKALSSVNVDFKLVIIGDGPEGPQMQEFVQKNELQACVSFLGYLDNEEAVKYYNAADVFFLPSEYEGISLALYESMAMGCVPVVSEVGGQKELVTEDCGFLVPRSNPTDESLQYLSILASLVKDHERRVALGKNCRTRIATHFDIALMHEKMETIFINSTQEKVQKQEPVITTEQLLKVYPMYFNLVKEAKELSNELYDLRNALYHQEQLQANNQHQNNGEGISHFPMNGSITISEGIYYKQLSSNISKWYYDEYERLPLWYKRVGHLIKVFKGQRTFKSLIKK